jgi:hypothetical protein
VNARRSIGIATIALVTLGGAVSAPLVDAYETPIQLARYASIIPSSNVSSGFEAAMKQASNPLRTDRTTVKPRLGPAVAAAVVARAAAPAAGRFAAKWGKRGFLAVGGGAAAAAGAEAGKDVYNAAKSLGKKVIGIWHQ